MSRQQKVVLRAAPKRIDALCEKVVAQLALHCILNKSRMMWDCTSGELEVALNRLEGLGLDKNFVQNRLFPRDLPATAVPADKARTAADAKSTVFVIEKPPRFGQNILSWRR